jgi:hypothetical protein
LSPHHYEGNQHEEASSLNHFTTVFRHELHARTRERLEGTAPPPPKVNDARVGLSGQIGLFITTIVGTMWAALLFTCLAFVSFPSVIRSGSSLIIVAWIAQTFLQLVLLPIIIVGQNIQAKAADRRAEGTYKDAEAVLHECVQIQQHLTAQDQAQQAQAVELMRLIAELRGQPPLASSGT